MSPRGWAEIADVSGIECVGIVKSCLGGEFAAGTKVAALMGGLGRTNNGGYAEYTRARVTNVAAIESGLSCGGPGRHPGVLRHGLDVPVPQPGGRCGPDTGRPGGDFVLRPGGPQHDGQRRGEGYRYDPRS